MLTQQVELGPAGGLSEKVDARKSLTTQSDQPQAEATVMPTPTGSTINITRQEYENALAKWQAQHVTEYDITLIDSSQMVIGGKMRLRFSVDAGEPHLVEYTRLGQAQPQSVPLSSLDADEKEHVQGLSVEKMFVLIGKLFNGNLTAAPGPVFDYDVAFDPTLGYPTHVYSSVSSQGGGPSVTECCVSYEVLRVDILKSSIPGMPKTGSPGP